MIDEKQEIIIKTLIQHKDVWKTAKGLEAILADCIPGNENKAIRNVILIAYKEGIVGALEEKHEIELVISRYITKLVMEYAIDNTVVEWCVETWRKIILEEVHKEGTISLFEDNSAFEKMSDIEQIIYKMNQKERTLGRVSKLRRDTRICNLLMGDDE